MAEQDLYDWRRLNLQGMSPEGPVVDGEMVTPNIDPQIRIEQEAQVLSWRTRVWRETRTAAGTGAKWVAREALNKLHLYGRGLRHGLIGGGIGGLALGGLAGGVVGGFIGYEIRQANEPVRTNVSFARLPNHSIQAGSDSCRLPIALLGNAELDGKPLYGSDPRLPEFLVVNVPGKLTASAGPGGQGIAGVCAADQDLIDALREQLSQKNIGITRVRR